MADSNKQKSGKMHMSTQREADLNILFRYLAPATSSCSLKDKDAKTNVNTMYVSLPPLVLIHSITRSLRACLS